jgi:hypothetical protein
MFVTQRKARVEPRHVLDGVDGHAAFADFAEYTLRVTVQAVKCRPVEGRAQAGAFLLFGEIVEAPIGVLGQSQAGKQARWFFRFPISDFGFAI